MQYFKFGWTYTGSNQIWTVSLFRGCLHISDISCPLGLPPIWPDCKAIPAYGLMLSICLSDIHILVNFWVKGIQLTLQSSLTVFSCRCKYIKVTLLFYLLFQVLQSLLFIEPCPWWVWCSVRTEQNEPREKAAWASSQVDWLSKEGTTYTRWVCNFVGVYWYIW